MNGTEAVLFFVLGIAVLCVAIYIGIVVLYAAIRIFSIDPSVFGCPWIDDDTSVCGGK